MVIACPHCGLELEAEESFAGQTIECPGCERDWKLPEPQRAVAASPLDQEAMAGEVSTPVQPHYWAFISYSSKDGTWGKWLHEGLETYSIPKALRGVLLDGETVLPGNLKPVFRDRDELSASDNLGAKICHALERSRFLVVLCSPHAAKSRWVDVEIENFRALGKGDRILALIVSGEPNSDDPATECFPPSLRYPHEPIAGDLREHGDGKTRGLLKIIAGITQLNFDLLYRREQRRRRNNRIMGTLAAIVLSGLGAVAWTYVKNAHQLASEASGRIETETRKTAEQAKLTEAERARVVRVSQEVERQKLEKAKQEQIAQSMSQEVTRQQEINSQQESAARLAAARQKWLVKAQQSTEDREFPMNAFYAAIGLGFRGFGYESLSDAEKAALDAKFPRLFNPAENPDLERAFLRITGSGPKTYLPLWTALHSNEVSCLAYGPDGRSVVSGGKDGNITIWDAVTGKNVATLTGHEKEVLSLAFSPNKVTLASGSWDKTIRLWDVPSRSQVNKLEGHLRGVTGVAFSPDGNSLASSGRDGTVRVWGKEPRVLPKWSDFYCMARSPDGRIIATGGHQRPLILWDYATGAQKVLLASEDGFTQIFSVAFSPDGTILASAGLDVKEQGGPIRLWDASGTLMGTLFGHHGAVRSLAFSPDGRVLVSGGDDKTIIMWDMAKRIKSATLRGHASAVTSLAFSPCGNALASGSKDRTVKLWDVAASKEEATIELYTKRGLGRLAFNLDGTLLATGDGIRKVGVPGTDTLPSIASAGGDVVFAPDGKHIAFLHGLGFLRDLATGVETQLAGISRCRGAAFSSDNRLLATIAGEKEAAAPKGAKVSSSLGLQIWDVSLHQLIRSIPLQSPLSESATSVIFTGSGNVVMCIGSDGSVQWIDAQTGEKQKASRLPFEVKSGTSGFSPDGALAAVVVGKGEILLWKVFEEREDKRITLASPEPTVSHTPSVVAITSDGMRLAVAFSSQAKNIVSMLDRDGNEVERLGEYPAGIAALVFSPRGDLLASRDWRNTARLWRLDTVQPDLASYFVRGWFDYDGATGSIVPTVPAADGFIGKADRYKFVRALGKAGP